jgi:DNA-binding transcriptional MerR regulator
MGNPDRKSYTAGQLAKVANVNIQTVRFYDRQGILKPASRTEAGYRIYDNEGVKRLNFIIQAKELGFSLKEIKEFLELRVQSVQTCDRVRKKTTEKLKDIQNKIAHLKKLEKTFEGLIGDCENRVISDQCPILEKMEV